MTIYSSKALSPSRSEMKVRFTGKRERLFFMAQFSGLGLLSQLLCLRRL